MLRIQIGNLAPLRRRRSLRLAEAHHIILVQLLKENQGVKKAVEAGFDFNGIINGLPLKKYVADTGLGRHGPHKNYTDQIRDHLSRWGEINIDNIKNKDLPAEEIANYLSYLTNSIKYKILTSTGRINLLNLNLP